MSPPILNPADPTKYSSCVEYAKARRPDLGPAGGGACNYIGKYQNSEKYYRVTEAVTAGRVDKTRLRRGTAVVWDKKVLNVDPGYTYGHVAIIEEVGPNYIIVSEANWGKATRRIEAQDLPGLHFIL